MASTQNTVGDFFSSLRLYLETTNDCTLKSDCTLDQLCANLLPLSEEQMRRALRRTASLALGKGHSVHLHSWTSPEAVAAQLTLIATQRQADLNDPSVSFEELLSHAFATLGLAYLFLDGKHSFEVIVKNRPSPFFHPMEIPVLA